MTYAGIAVNSVSVDVRIADILDATYNLQSLDIDES
jgi:hypothetical protein